jgi:NADH-quinone oxidoreductase subunit M
MNGLYPVLSAVTFVPIAGALVVMLLGRNQKGVIRWITLAVTVVNFVISLPLFFEFDRVRAGMQFVERAAWIPQWNINYAMGVDGISVLFILLSTLVGILSVTISWESVTEKVKEYYISLLLIEGAMIGVFAATDMFLFYIFWEAMLIPMYLLIGIWGGKKRIYAAIKFFLYTLVGSLLMLVGIIVLYLSTGTFEITELTQKTFSYTMQLSLFWAFFAAFAVKVPMFPVHTWLPDAHTEAPTAGSVILAAVLIKMGAYGFLRFSIPLFPDATKAMMPYMLALSAIAIVYGGLICLVQSDIKRLIAYSSVSHMGFVTLGIFALNPQGIEGGILQMINHGIVTGALFLSIGMIYDRTHTRQISDYGGLATPLPIFAAFFLVFTMASIGLPGLNGFVGEFLIILGGFAADKIAGVVAATGIIIGAAYMLWLYQRVFFTEVNEKVKQLKDLNMREILTLVPMLVLIFWIGVYPNTFLDIMHTSVGGLLEKLNAPSVASGIQLLVK